MLRLIKRAFVLIMCIIFFACEQTEIEDNTVQNLNQVYKVIEDESTIKNSFLSITNALYSVDYKDISNLYILLETLENLKHVIQKLQQYEYFSHEYDEEYDAIENVLKNAGFSPHAIANIEYFNSLMDNQEFSTFQDVRNGLK